jgi:hypothetical protein
LWCLKATVASWDHRGVEALQLGNVLLAIRSDLADAASADSRPEKLTICGGAKSPKLGTYCVIPIPVPGHAEPECSASQAPATPRARHTKFPCWLKYKIQDAPATETNVDGYVRSVAIETFLVLWSSEQMSRDEVVAYYRSLFHGKLENRGSPAWEGLVSAVADLRAPELLEEVREAFANDLVDPMFARFDEIERDILGPPRPLCRYGIIEDAISEMHSWYCFNRQESTARKPPRSPAMAISAAASTKNAAPIHREKIGRNQPCPCGSGKKYKKCCGSN